MIYNFYDFRSKKNENLVKKLIKSFERIFPYWAKDISCIQRPSDGNAIATVCLEPEYRRIVINIMPEFFLHDKEECSDFLLHEVCHAINGTYATWVKYTVLEFIKDKYPDAYEILDTEHTNKFESITEELKYTMKGLLNDQGSVCN